MRHTLLLIFSFISLVINAQYYVVDTLKLNNSYDDLIKDPDNVKYQEAFFNAFPASWVEYSNTYIQPRIFQEENINPIAKPFDDKMSELFYKHIDAYQNLLNSIPDSLYCAKLINTSIGALYECDAPNFLQSALHDTMEHRKAVMMKIISEMTIGDQLRFWLFYWASEFRDVYLTEFEKLYSDMIEKYPEEAATMKIGYEYACGNSLFDTFGHIGQKKYQNIKN